MPLTGQLVKRRRISRNQETVDIFKEAGVE